MEEAAKPKKKRGLPAHLNVPWTVGDILLALLFYTIVIVFLVELIYVISVVWPPIKTFLSGADSGNNVAGFESFDELLLNYVPAIAVIWFFLHKYKVGWKEAGWRSIDLKKALLWLGGIFVVFWVASIAVLTIVSVLDPSFNANQAQSNPIIPSVHSQTLLAFIGLVIFPPFFEETIFRGFIFAGLAKKWGVWIGAIVSSAFFGLVHGQANTSVYTFVLGMLLCFTYVKTKSIYPGIGIHMVNNLFAFLALYYK